MVAIRPITRPTAQLAVDKGDQAVLKLERDGHIRNWRVVIADEKIVYRGRDIG